MGAKLPHDQLSKSTKRNKFTLKTKFISLNQRGTEKLLIKTQTHHQQ